MKIEVRKISHLVFSLALGFTVYYAYSVYNGNRQMVKYEDAKRENEKSIHKLDSLIKHFDERNFNGNQLVDFANQRETAYEMRTRIENNKAVGSGVYQRRLIKFYCGLGLLILSSIISLYLKKKEAHLH